MKKIKSIVLFGMMLTGAAFAASPPVATIVDSVAKLKTLGAAYPYAMTTGYYANSIIGGASYAFNSSDSRADNGCTIIQPAGLATGRYNLIDLGIHDVATCGAKLDNATDDAAAWNAALRAFPGGTVTCPHGELTSRVSSQSLFFGGTTVNRVRYATNLISDCNINFRLPANEHWTGDGATKVFHAVNPMVGYVVSTYVGGSFILSNARQGWGCCGADGRTLTFNEAPPNGAPILLTRDGITISANNAKLHVQNITGNLVGGDLVNLRDGVGFTLDNTNIFGSARACYAITPTPGYGPDFVEQFQTFGGQMQQCAQADMLLNATGGSFINIGNVTGTEFRTNQWQNSGSVTVGGRPIANFSISGYQLRPEDVGRRIDVVQCGYAGATLHTSIASVTSGSTGSFTKPAQTNCSGAAATIGSIAPLLFLGDNQGVNGQVAGISFHNNEFDCATSYDAIQWRNVSRTSGSTFQEVDFYNPSTEATGAGCPGYVLDAFGGVPAFAVLYTSSGAGTGITGFANNFPPGRLALINWNGNNPLGSMLVGPLTGALGNAIGPTAVAATTSPTNLMTFLPGQSAIVSCFSGDGVYVGYDLVSYNSGPGLNLTSLQASGVIYSSSGTTLRVALNGGSTTLSCNTIPLTQTGH